MVNRVHPETGRAWAGRNDYRVLEDILRPLSVSSASVRYLDTTAGFRESNILIEAKGCRLGSYGLGAHRREAICRAGA